ncbi:hypothetical protein Tsubulata_008822 [Turnera subulata]|uniref:Serine-rich protein-like protein n=1 Tax=Turnera subulata TaxID=218843 RepID=A0A9Q0J0Q8_9ROSI|nr:hypothetical protein Tsubulata_008822 [Turnera subulata]
MASTANSNAPPLSCCTTGHLSPHPSIPMSPSAISPSRTASATFLSRAASFPPPSTRLTPPSPPQLSPTGSNNKDPKRTCSCSPTNHPGSFRCGFHRSSAPQTPKKSSKENVSPMSSVRPALDLRKLAMTNSAARLVGGSAAGGAELVKKAYSSLMISPSLRHLRRRANFQPRHSCLSVVSN